MTPDPNPSPELRKAAEALLLAMTKRALRGRDHVPSMRDEQTAASALRAALSPQALPAPGEVEADLLILQLALSEVASCSCNTKTDEARYHDRRCLYRVLRDAQAEIERLTALTDKYFWQVRDTCTRAEKAEATLATVAAANDEGVASAIEALKPLADLYLTGSEADDECAIDASDFPNAGHVRAARAAIRLLSQGEGA